ncbi:MAG: outer membrane lipoprotein-sorting protein [Nannocystaceae bacterium]
MTNMTMMRRSLLAGVTAAACLGLLGPSTLALAAPVPPPTDSPEFPMWVMDQIDDMHRGDSSHGVMTMTVKTEHFSRSLTMESWSRGEDYSLVQILAPKKEKGTATLKNGEDLFTFLAKTGRTIKISGAMMGSAWMGSHFTNNDLVKSSRMADDYTIVLTGQGTLGGVPQYVFTLTPKPDAAVVWGKIEVTIRQQGLLPTREIFYDEDGEAVRALEFKDYKEVDGRMLAGSLVVRPLDGSGEFTRIVYDSLEFGVELPDSMFTLQHLKAM